MIKFRNSKITKVIALVLVLVFSSQQVGLASVTDLRDGAGFEDYALAIAAGYLAAQAIPANATVSQIFITTYLMPEIAKQAVKAMGLKGTAALVANVFISTLLVSSFNYGNSAIAEAGSNASGVLGKAGELFGKMFRGAVFQGALADAITAAVVALIVSQVKKIFKGCKILGEAIGYWLAKQIGHRIRMALQKSFGIFLWYHPQRGPTVEEKPKDDGTVDVWAEGKSRGVSDDEAGGMLAETVKVKVWVDGHLSDEGNWVEGHYETQELTRDQALEYMRQGRVQSVSVLVPEHRNSDGVVVGEHYETLTYDKKAGAFEDWVSAHNEKMGYDQAMARQDEIFKQQSKYDNYRVAATVLLSLAGFKGEALILLSSGAGAWMAGGSVKEGLMRGAISALLQWMSRRTKSALHGAVFALGASTILEYVVIGRDQLGREQGPEDAVELVQGKKDYELFRELVASAVTNANANFYSFGRAVPDVYGTAHGREFGFRWTSGNDVFFLTRYADYAMDVQKNGVGVAMMTQFVNAYHSQAVNEFYKVVSGEIKNQFYVKRLREGYDRRLNDVYERVFQRAQELLVRKGEVSAALLAEAGDADGDGAVQRDDLAARVSILKGEISKSDKAIAELQKAIVGLEKDKTTDPAALQPKKDELAKRAEDAAPVKAELFKLQQAGELLDWLDNFEALPANLQEARARQARRELIPATLAHIGVAFDPVLVGLGAATLLGKDGARQEMATLAARTEQIEALLSKSTPGEESHEHGKATRQLRRDLSEYDRLTEERAVLQGSGGWQTLAAIHGEPYVSIAPEVERNMQGRVARFALSPEVERERIKATPEYQANLQEQTAAERARMEDENGELPRIRHWVRDFNPGISGAELQQEIDKEINKELNKPETQEMIAARAYKLTEPKVLADPERGELVGTAEYRGMVGGESYNLDRWKYNKPVSPPTVVDPSFARTENISAGIEVRALPAYGAIAIPAVPPTPVVVTPASDSAPDQNPFGEGVPYYWIQLQPAMQGGKPVLEDTGLVYGGNFDLTTRTVGVYLLDPQSSGSPWVPTERQGTIASYDQGTGKMVIEFGGRNFNVYMPEPRFTEAIRKISVGESLSDRAGFAEAFREAPATFFAILDNSRYTAAQKAQVEQYIKGLDSSFDRGYAQERIRQTLAVFATGGRLSEPHDSAAFLRKHLGDPALRPAVLEILSDYQRNNPQAYNRLVENASSAGVSLPDPQKIQATEGQQVTDRRWKNNPEMRRMLDDLSTAPEVKAALTDYMHGKIDNAGLEQRVKAYNAGLEQDYALAMRDYDMASATMAQTFDTATSGVIAGRIQIWQGTPGLKAYAVASGVITEAQSNDLEFMKGFVGSDRFMSAVNGYNNQIGSAAESARMHNIGVDNYRQGLAAQIAPVLGQAAAARVAFGSEADFRQAMQEFNTKATEDQRIGLKSWVEKHQPVGLSN